MLVPLPPLVLVLFTRPRAKTLLSMSRERGELLCVTIIDVDNGDGDVDKGDDNDDNDDKIGGQTAERLVMMLLLPLCFVLLVLVLATWKEGAGIIERR
jgi:hypothetical protein